MGGAPHCRRWRDPISELVAERYPVTKRSASSRKKSVRVFAVHVLLDGLEAAGLAFLDRRLQ
jgi:hypothetical protein